MKGRICFMMVSVMLAVSTGFSYDISAYGYESPLQQAYMQHEDVLVTGEVIHQSADQKVAKEHIEEAVSEVNTVIEEIRAEEARLQAEREEAERARAAQSVVAQQAPMGGMEEGLLAQIVMAEAGCEDLQGQIMVANVILNRIRAGYGSSISDIVYAPGQFEPVSNGTLWSVSPTASVYEAVSRALAGEDYSQGALFFVSSACDYSWFMEDLMFVTQHGGHLFFR